MAPEIIILRGLPGSGKSTWARQQCLENPQFRRVSKDDIRAMLCGLHSPFNEAIVCTIRNESIKAIVCDGYSAIIDDTNIHPMHIQTIERIAQELGATTRLLDFNTPRDECIARDAVRPNPVGADVIRKMDIQWHGLSATDMDMVRDVMAR